MSLVYIALRFIFLVIQGAVIARDKDMETLRTNTCLLLQ